MKPSHKLLTRTGFREGVFERDDHHCVLCREEGRIGVAMDAHHIVERRLWPDEGYYLANGVSVCERHHRLCESTEVSCEEVRAAAGITSTILPPQFYPDDVIDKWGNAILPNGQRLRGELWGDESVMRVIAPVLHRFTRFTKPPRTAHLPWSDGVGRDDTVWRDTSSLAGREVVVTLKIDGENNTVYGPEGEERGGYVHARRTEPLASDPSRNQVKAVAAELGPELPEGWRFQAENIMGVHTIRYANLRPHPRWFFQMFRVWQSNNVALSWDEMSEWAELLGLPTVPVLWRGTWSERAVRELDALKAFEGDRVEGYVVAPAAGFSLREHARLVAKYVRPDFRGPDQHNRPWSRDFNAPRTP